MDKEIIEKLIIGFNLQLTQFELEEIKLELLRDQFVKDYSIENIEKLTKETYCTGIDKTTFCYRIEHELKDLGDMRGAFANKFGLYYGKEGYDIEKKYRITPKFGDDPDSAMNEIKKQIIDLLTAAENDNKQDIRNNKLSHIFKSKILGTYFPNKYLNIYSEEHLNFFLNKIGLSVVPKADILEKQEMLINWMKKQPNTNGWSLLTLEKFLYTQIGKPKKIKYDPKIPTGSILSSNDIKNKFDVSSKGNIRKSKSKNLIVIITDHTKPSYSDKWYGNVIHYTLTKQNKILVDAIENDMSIYLCEIFEKDKYIFHGKVELIQEPFQKEQIDFNGMLQKVLVFPLKIIDNKGSLDKNILESYELNKKISTKKISNDTLKMKINSTTKENVEYRTVSSNVYIRNQDIAEYTKRRAKGVCQLCGQQAPFNDKNGNPYLECHHIIWLSKGGSDSIDNTVALCPNCHKKMHIIADEKDVKFLQEKISKK